MGSLEASVQAQDAKEREEHWRLLYVAMTRAEEHLIIGGALRSKQIKNGMSDQCWHVQIDRALQSLGAAVNEDAKFFEKQAPEGTARKASDLVEHYEDAQPDWMHRPAAPESRPTRPLAPSAILPLDEESSPPPTADMQKAARRGVLLHSLFERLSAVPVPEREASVHKWLQHSAGIEEAAERNELASAALQTISNPSFAAIFGESALAEVPLAGVVDGYVIAGTMDRLLVSDDEVLVVDFKTGRRVPTSAEAVTLHHKAQMAAYVAVLEGVFPGRAIRAALLYSSGPALIELPAAILKAHKPGFTDAQQEFDTGG